MRRLLRLLRLHTYESVGESSGGGGLHSLILARARLPMPPLLLLGWRLLLLLGWSS